MRIKNLKLIVGIMLIVVSLTSFIFWETKGRDMVYREELVVASQEIRAGDVLSNENITVRSIDSKDVISGAAADEDYEKLIGRTAEQYIPQGAQLNTEFLSEEGAIELGIEESIFAIESDLIDMVSSSLRRGDRVRVYGNSGKEFLGEYRVAFVKDSSDREVKNLETLNNNKPLEREDSNYRISSIEIICTRGDYAKIVDFAAVSGEGLTIVQVM